MFFFFENDDFENALSGFHRTEADDLIAHEASRQIEEFQHRFPLAELGLMNLTRYFGHGSRREDFCYWITYGTKSVAGKIPFAQKRLGVRFSKSSGEIEFPNLVEQPDEGAAVYGKEEIFQRTIWQPLMHFIKSEGKECREEVECIFGRSLLLKILILYYPNDFAHVLSVHWLDRIIWMFKLRQSGDYLEKSRQVNAFIRAKINKFQHLRMSDVVTAIYDYIGLGSWDDHSFETFLIENRGFSHNAAEECARKVRKVSRELITKRATVKSIDKLSADEILKLFEENFSRELFADLRSVVEFYCEYRRGLEEGKRQVGADEDNRAKGESGLAERMSAANSAAEVVRILQDSAMSHKVYWHYTVLSSLLCILEDKTLRLTRGDDPQMNDQLEWERMGSVDTWHRTFITSFSHLSDESVAMWSVYGVPKNEAVRLALNREVLGELLDDIRSTSSIFIADSIKDENAHKLNRHDVIVEFGDVLYGGGVNQTGGKQYEEFEFLGRRTKNALIASHALDQAPEMTGYIKSADWSYEKESRLIVRIKEGVLLPRGVEMKTHMIVTIQEAILGKILYLLGPCMAEKLQAIARASIERKLKEMKMVAHVDVSRYSGRLKLRS